MNCKDAIQIIRRYECNAEHYEACEMAISALIKLERSEIVSKGFEEIFEESSVIPERIKAAMDSKGISQRELAKECKITEATMSRYLNGKRIPKATMLLIIANTLGVSVDYLLGNENNNTAYWKKEKTGGFSPGGNPLYRCSNCGWVYGTHSVFPTFRYCPECGKKMNGGSHE